MREVKTKQDEERESELTRKGKQTQLYSALRLFFSQENNMKCTFFSGK